MILDVELRYRTEITGVQDGLLHGSNMSNALPSHRNRASHRVTENLEKKQLLCTERQFYWAIHGNNIFSNLL